MDPIGSWWIGTSTGPSVSAAWYRLSNSNQVSSVGASCPPSHGYPMDTPWEPSTVNSISTHILQAFLKDANHNSLIFCKPSWAGRLICAVMALVLQSVSWPINEKVNQSINQSIKLVINRSITKKISESQGISACSGCWFFYGCSDANPP